MIEKEKEIARVVAGEMKRVGFDRVKVDPLANVVGTLKGKNPRFRLMLNGHIDHAEAGSMKDPHSGKIVERNGQKVIWGRGACDMKGAVAAMVYAGKAVQDSGVKLKNSALVTAVSLEEAGKGEGIKRLLKREKIKADMAISGEATNLQVNLGHRGKLEFDVLVKGKTTHGSTPHTGQPTASAARNASDTASSLSSARSVRPPWPTFVRQSALTRRIAARTFPPITNTRRS